MKRLPEEDLQHIFNHTTGMWETLRDKSIFITGGTGFFGKWFIESFLFCNRKLGLNAKATVLSRAPDRFLVDFPDLRDEKSLTFIKGDIDSFQFPSEPFAMIVHAAVDYKESLELYDSIVNGTKRVLDFAVFSGATRILFTSSGAVYGKQPPDLSHVPEDYSGAPDPMLSGSAYGLAKRAAEFYGTEFARRHHFDFLIARCFAYSGPYLPLDKGAAIGNFIRDALSGKELIIEGDGSPYRSYMYAADLMIWLWAILFRGKSSTPYNVGSEEEISISDLAHEVVAIVNPSLRIAILKKKTDSRLPDRYVPSTMRAKQELSLEVQVSRKTGISRMANWYK